MPRALVAGCNGQDGTYLSVLLVQKGYDVVGIDHRSVGPPAGVSFLVVDVCDAAEVARLVRELRPEEIYFLAAFHHSSESEMERADKLIQRSFEVNTLALTHMLDAVSTGATSSRVFYAASSRVFGEPPGDPQTEATPLNPVCAYGISKAAGIQICRFYRKRLGLHASVGILYNHESPLRSMHFVSRKIVSGAVAIKKGVLSELLIADLDAPVDWGYAPDYVRAMWAILQLDVPGDFVIASGTIHTVREFAAVAFEVLGLNWEDYVRQKTGARPYRRLTTLRGDSSRLQSLTGWRPEVDFREMVALMIDAEMANDASLAAG